MGELQHVSAHRKTVYTFKFSLEINAQINLSLVCKARSTEKRHVGPAPLCTHSAKRPEVQKTRR